jgi:CDP-glycerol glycerophosphotransferase
LNLLSGKKGDMSILTINKAREAGYGEVFVPYPALGDQILMLYATRLRYELTGEKTLLGTTAPELFEHQNCCDALENCSALTILRMFSTLSAAGFKVFPATYYQARKNSEGRLCFHFPDKHILAEICSRLGLSGEIPLDPVFELTDEEQAFGRFFSDRQIAIMSQGKEKRKSWGVENMQNMVDSLRDRYNFVQIGAPNDALLTGVLDKRGAFPLRRVAAVLRNSDLFVGGIGALMHLARGVNCRSVITYSLSEPLDADSYPCNRNLLPASGCVACRESLISSDREDEECFDAFSCIHGITVDAVTTAVEDMAHNPRPLSVERVEISARPTPPLTPLTARLFGMAQSQTLTGGRAIKKQRK